MKKTVICIGREYGSGGREIGERLAAALDIPCYDKLILKKTAEESHLSYSLLKDEDEKPVNHDRFLTGDVFVDSAGIQNAFYSESQITFDAERRVIEELAAKGSCVIIGRCASSLLRDSLGADKVLSVFIYANPEQKLSRIMNRNSLNRRDAEKRMKRIDRMRRQYFDFYSETQWGKPESYDIMLSSSSYGIDGCVDLLVTSMKERV